MRVASTIEAKEDRRRRFRQRITFGLGALGILTCFATGIPSAVAACGDGVPEQGEGCDDGNAIDGDGCDTNCTTTACGNGVVTAEEQCDDENLIDGDGCEANCVRTPPDQSRGFLYIPTRSHRVTVVDGATNSVVTTIPIRSPSTVAIHPSHRWIYVGSVTEARISVVDTTVNEVVDTIEPISNGNIAVSADGMHLYVAYGTSLLVIDIATKAILATVPLAYGTGSIAVHPTMPRVYVGGSGGVSVVDTDTYAVTATVPVGYIITDLEIHPLGTELYVASAYTGLAPGSTLAVINTLTNSVSTIDLDPRIQGQIALDPSGRRLYLASSYPDVTVVDTATKQVLAPLEVGWNPHGGFADVAVDPTGRWLYLLTSSVLVLDIACESVIQNVRVGVQPGPIFATGPNPCGNGRLEADEECDDGNSRGGDGCDSNCTATACGNGIVTIGESCDDGNTVNTDGCSSLCIGECGDGSQGANEECDDGNRLEGDGCDSNCMTTACGNGIATPGEECDDGNLLNGDACNSDCTLNVCGDGIVRVGVEQCDDGTVTSGDGCSATCEQNVIDWASAEAADAFVFGSFSGTSMSRDGRYVVFQVSETGRLIVHDRLTGSTDVLAVQGSEFAQISADGRYVALRWGPFVRLYDRVRRTTEVIASDASSIPQLSADGRYVALLRNDLLMIHDTLTGTAEQASVDSNGFPLAAAQFSMSADARYVAFDSLFMGVFVRDRVQGLTQALPVPLGKLSGDGRYMAFASGGGQVSVYDLEQGTVDLASLNDAEVPGNGDSAGWFAISDDGRFVAFQSDATNLVPGGTNGVPNGLPHVFRRDRFSRTTQQVTIGSSGEPADWGGQFPSINGDGRSVSFSSGASNLVPAKVDASTQEIYVWTECGSAICGDGHLDIGCEQCDDGNIADGDGCEKDCSLTIGCGNARVDIGEQCDDGNFIPGDSCSTDCRREKGNAHTAAGTNVTVGPLPDLTISFGSVLEAGTTAAVRVEPVVPVPSTYIQPAKAIEIATRATTQGSATLCLQYDEQHAADEGAIRILHYEAEACDWVVEPLTFQDLGNNLACAEVGGFSPFRIAEQQPIGCGNGTIDPGEACDDMNLSRGDGCSGSCQLEFIPGGGPSATDCGHAWVTGFDPARNEEGLPLNVQECTEGDPGCDSGPAGDNLCTFRVRLCFNTSDQRSLCSPTDVAVVKLPTARGVIDSANRNALEAALEAKGALSVGECTNPGLTHKNPCLTNLDCDSVAGSADGACGRRSRIFRPPLDTRDSCTDFALVNVPLRLTATGARFGRKVLKAIATPSNNPATGAKRRKDRDSLKLVCRPGT